MSLLACKIGNTNIGLGLLDGFHVTHTWRLETRAEKTADEYAVEIQDMLGSLGQTSPDITAAAIVSVVPALTPIFIELARRYFRVEPFVVGPGIQTGLKVHYQDPRALGSDRLVAVIAAREKFGSPLLVVDFGTATTFNALDARGEFVGGAIAPGLNIESEALHLFTARLPRVEISPPAHALATNTQDSLRSGIFLGYAGLVEGLISRLRAELPLRTRVVATGGLTLRLAPYCPSIEIVDLQLAYEGLRLLYEMNQPRPL